MDVHHVAPSPPNWLVANLAVSNIIIGKVCFENPEETFFVHIQGHYLTDFKPIIHPNQLN